jgi:hypothetical protein
MTRKWSFTSRAVGNVTVHIDNRLIAKLENGKSAQFQIPAGKRIISIQAPYCPTNEYEFTFAEGRQYSFTILARGGRGFDLKPDQG